jgi:two-component system cell cycle sensor histidine kinase/response regulator CckA
LSRLLTRAGYRVLAARDGIEAVQLFSGDNGKAISLVLLDVVMPNLGGAEAADRIRLLDPTVKVLFASGSREKALTRRTELSPMLQKPYEPDRLLRVIRRLLDGEDGANHSP